MTCAEWQQEAETNARLLPEYGNLPKTDNQKQADKELIEPCPKLDTTALKVSEHIGGRCL